MLLQGRFVIRSEYENILLQKCLKAGKYSIFLHYFKIYGQGFQIDQEQKA